MNHIKRLSDYMECWQSNFNNKTLKDGLKHKDNIKDTYYDGYTFTAAVKSYDVELIIQDDMLFDMSCTCSKKSPCAHQAGVLYFIEEFPEVLRDYTGENIEKISKINMNNDLKIISDTKLKKFLKTEFKRNPKLKYNFIKHFSNESLVDEKAYGKKLKKILKRGREAGFANHGFYDLRIIGSDVKKFMKKDIRLLVDLGEYKIAYDLLNEIMDIFIDQIYWDDRHWYDIAHHYREYAYELFEKNVLTQSQMKHMKSHIRIINPIVF